MPHLPTIETPRTVLTIFQPDNANLMMRYSLKNKERLAQWEPSRDEDFYSEEAFRDRAKKSLAAFASGTEINFIAVDRVAHEMVASCSFSNITRGPFMACYMGYSVTGECEGSGIMREVAVVATAYIFEVAGLHRIMANRMPTNGRSERLLKALGFEREGYAKAYLKITGKWEDMVLNSLINPRA